MNSGDDWQQYWDKRAEQASSDFTFDRGEIPRTSEIDRLSHEELLAFIAPSPEDDIFDAGCGTGGVMLSLRPLVRSVSGMDFSAGAVERCRLKLDQAGYKDVSATQGSITSIPLPDASVNKILCLSVLQYLDDTAVRQALREFARVLKPGGILVLHVKNLASLYLATLRIAKHLKRILGRPVKLEYVRTFGWYRGELSKAGFSIVDYTSSSRFAFEKMPTTLLLALQQWELRHRDRWFLRVPPFRHLGAELKLKASKRALN